ncbi:MAG: hypothetical protein IKX23_03825 [Treponema sp.]|nr:hypothetical protein [Treponema sp.]
MRVLGIENLQRSDSQIFYIRRYSGIAKIELPKSVEDTPISFSIEMDCLGNKSVCLDIQKQIDYPLLPLKKGLIEFIISEDREGRLPC